MAFALITLNSKCTLNCTKLINNALRSGVASYTTYNNQIGSMRTFKPQIQLSNAPMLSSKMLQSFNNSIGNKYIHRVTAADDKTLSHGSHDKLWTIERLMSIGLLGILPVGIMFPSQPGDALMAISMVMHSYWGLESVVTDYVRPILFGTLIPKISHGILILITASTLGGLFYFIYNDIGIANSIRKLWAIKGQ